MRQKFCSASNIDDALKWLRHDKLKAKTFSFARNNFRTHVLRKETNVRTLMTSIDDLSYDELLDGDCLGHFRYKNNP